MDATPLLEVEAVAVHLAIGDACLLGNDEIAEALLNQLGAFRGLCGGDTGLGEVLAVDGLVMADHDDGV